MMGQGKSTLPHWLVSLVVLAIAVQGCGRRERAVKIILPVRFCNEFAIVQDAQAGQETRADSSGSLVFRIPPNGMLKVRDLSVFFEWHKEAAFFEDGTPIPSGPGVGDSIIALRHVANADTSSVRYFIGKKADWLHFQDKTLDNDKMTTLPELSEQKQGLRIKIGRP